MRAFIKFRVSPFLILMTGGCTPFPSQPPEATILSNDLLLDGTKVDDLDLSGSITLEAQTKINGWAKDKLEETRFLLYNKTETPIMLNELGIEVDQQKIVEEIERNPGKALPGVLKDNSLKVSQELQDKLNTFSRPMVDIEGHSRYYR